MDTDEKTCSGALQSSPDGSSSELSKELRVPDEDSSFSTNASDHIHPKKQALQPRTARCLSSPTAQLFILGILFFLGPGMFCSLNGLGGAGLSNPVPANTANVGVYAAFAVVGVVAAPIVNKIGFQSSFLICGLGYVLYASSLLTYKINGNSGFLIAAGIILGSASALLWTSQGAMLISYPSPESKGRYISLVWGIFNLGAGLGSLLVFALGIHSDAGGISNATFAGFISLMFCGALGSIFICNKETVLGNNYHDIAPITWTGSLRNLLLALRTHKHIIAMFPMFFVSNYYYPYIFNDMNLLTYNIRTRALNNTLFWLMEIPGSFFLGYLLDKKNLRRSTRARLAFGLVLALTLGIWGWGYSWQRGYSRARVTSTSFVPLDFTDLGYAGPLVLFMFYGFFDAIWQSNILWLLGAIGDGSENAAELASFYKCIQSAGAAVAFRLNIDHNHLMTDLLVSWGMLLGSLMIAAPVILGKIRD